MRDEDDPAPLSEGRPASQGEDRPAPCDGDRPAPCDGITRLNLGDEGAGVSDSGRSESICGDKDGSAFRVGVKNGAAFSETRNPDAPPSFAP